MTTTNTVSTGLTEVDARALRSMLESGDAVVIDVREPEEHARERIESSVLMPLSAFDPSEVPADGRTVVLHCRSGARSAQAAKLLLDTGRPQAHHLKGGIAAWRAAGLPVHENKRVPISIMRQVQIVAGSIVVAGTLLGAIANPWWLMLSGFIGAGLVFAGVSGTCGLATLLRAMPWNRIATRSTS